MFQFLEKKIIGDFLSKAPIEAVILIFIVLLTIYIATKVKGLVRVLSVAIKQQHKCEAIICRMPCVNKENGIWLTDVERNGGSPPCEIKCNYLKDKGVKK